jgi:hypothetical protein
MMRKSHYTTDPLAKITEMTTNFRCSDAITAHTTYDDHLVSKDYLALSETTDGTTNVGSNTSTENWNGFVPGDAR